MVAKTGLQNFLHRLASRKFLVTIAVQLACLYAFFRPATAETGANLAIQIASLATMVLAAFGYGIVEASVDKEALKFDEGKTVDETEDE